MRRSTRVLTIMFLILFALSGTAPAKTVAPPASESGDKTLSPYFFVKSDDPAARPAAPEIDLGSGQHLRRDCRRPGDAGLQERRQKGA